MKKLRKDVRAGIIIACEIEVGEDRSQAISHSPTVALKKMPGRTLSVDYRIVSDLRQINVGNHKADFYPVEVVKLTDLFQRILKLQRHFPTFAALMTKRDIASAFKRILLRPDIIHISTTDILGEKLGLEHDLFMGHLDLPFGWVAIPSYFKIHTDAIAAIHNHFKHGKGAMSGNERFNSFI